MTVDELAAIRDWWLCSPEDFAQRPRWPLRDARADITTLVGEVLRLQAQLRAEREALELTMEYVESGGESGARAW